MPKKIRKLQTRPRKKQRGPWNLKQNAIESIILIHLQIGAGSGDGLKRRRRGQTTWGAAQRNPSARAEAAVERQPYCH
jgi:hypothetical protein